ncbi:MAG: hypothetical protein AB1761_11395 [Pseudomonadota bacterium]
MKRLAWLLLAAAAFAARAGDITVTKFEPGAPLPKKVLEHVALKGVIAEFIDPERADLGKEIAYLLWREVLTAISDQRGAGVILARAPGNERLVDLLQQDYHEAAVRIAQGQGARMAIWGSVAESGGRVYLDTYLSLIGQAERDELLLRLTTGGADTGLVARIPRTRFNFAPVETTRDALFRRTVIARAGAIVRAAAGSGRALATLKPGQTLQAEGMQGGWFVVRMPDGRGYVDVNRVDVPPRQVETGAAEVALRAGPARNAKPSGRAAPNGTYQVTDMRYLAGGGLWYRIAAPTGDGWVPATAIRPRFSVPVVHFVAGLYRYQLGRWDDAAREFDQYLRAPGVAADNASYATACQLLGASRLASASRAESLPGASGWEDAFERAIRATPYDPAAYTLRAVSTIAVRRTLEPAVGDLKRALELDPQHADTRTALAQISAHVTGTSSKLQPLRLAPASPALRRDLDALAQRYAVPR